MSPDTTPSNFRVQGCPVANNEPACPRCHGWFRGWNGERLVRATERNQLPRILCDVLETQVGIIRKNGSNNNA